MANEIANRDQLAAALARVNLNREQWATLKNSVYPGAANASIIMAAEYCVSRSLDVLQKPVHIVQMKVKDSVTEEEKWRDVIMPGIYLYRTIAHRTGEYMGCAPVEFGDDVTSKYGPTAPVSCTFTVRRWHPKAERVIEFAAPPVYFDEVCATRWDYDEKKHVANSRWTRAPRQMLAKCAEAAALRMAFPDELGGEMTVEEVNTGAVYDMEEPQPVEEPKPFVEPDAAADDAKPATKEQPDPEVVAPANDTLTETQAAKIMKRLMKCSVGVPELCKHMRVNTVEEIKRVYFDDALEFIDQNTE